MSKNFKKAIIDEVATSQKDIDIFSGWLQRLENPDPTLRTEAHGKGLALYDEIKRDTHAGSVLQTRCLAVTAKKWSILPAESKNKTGRPNKVTQEQKIADFVKDVLVGTNFEQAVQEILQAFLYGFYMAEVIWKLKDGTVQISKIRAKHPRRFSFTLDREARLLTLDNMMEGEAIPAKKFIHFAFGSSDNPYGNGLGQGLWWPVWFKKHAIKFWLVFLEKWGMPTGVGKYPPGTPLDMQQDLLDAVDAIQKETGVKIPDNMTIDLLEASRSGSASYEGICEYMDKQISKAVLGQTATVEGTPGKLGAEEAQQLVRQDILEADASLLCETINESLIHWIVDYNFPEITNYPTFIIYTKQEQDLKPLAERDEILASKIGLPITTKYFYDTYGIPAPEEGEDIVEARPAPAGNEQSAAFAEKSFSPEQQTVEDLIGETMAQVDAPMKNLTQEVKTVIQEAKSLEEIQDKLFSLYGKTDTKDFEDLLVRAMYVADLYGRSAAKKSMDKQLKQAE